MEKYIYIFVIIFFVVVLPLALYLILKPMLQHQKLLKGIVNYDALMKKYVFSIALKKEDFYAQLKTHNTNDVLKYTLSDDCTIITFKMYYGKYPYKINVDTLNEAIILKVEQIAVTSKPAFYINEFFINKFDAVPLDFEKYKF